MQYSEVYRGVVVVKSSIQDEYGNKVPCQILHYTKPYYKKNIAAGQATRLAGIFSKSVLVDKYVERVSSWERLD